MKMMLLVLLEIWNYSAANTFSKFRLFIRIGSRARPCRKESNGLAFPPAAVNPVIVSWLVFCPLCCVRVVKNGKESKEKVKGWYSAVVSVLAWAIREVVFLENFLKGRKSSLVASTTLKTDKSGLIFVLWKYSYWQTSRFNGSGEWQELQLLSSVHQQRVSRWVVAHSVLPHPPSSSFHWAVPWAMSTSIVS